MTALFPLLPTDMGRNLTQLVPTFDDRELIADVHAVLESGEPLTSGVLDGSGHRYARSIHRRGPCGAYPAGVIVSFAAVEPHSACGADC